MELDDCAFPHLAGVEIGADANTIFDGVNLALLVGDKQAWLTTEGFLDKISENLQKAMAAG